MLFYYCSVTQCLALCHTSSAVGAAPDLLVLGGADEVVAVVGVGDADEHLGPLPGGAAGQVDGAVFGDDVIALAAGVGDDLAVEVGEDAGAAPAFFVHVGGVHADKGLAAAGHGGAGQVVQLAAGPADVAEAGALGVDLSVEVDGDAVVDRDHLVLAGDDLGGVHIFQGLDDDAGVAVHPVIEGLGSENDAGDALAGAEGLAFVGEFARLVELIVGVPAELSVHAEVFYIGLCQDRADHVGQGSDAQLKGGAVFDERNQNLRDPDLLGRCLGDRKFGQGRMGSLYHIVYV